MALRQTLLGVLSYYSTAKEGTPDAHSMTIAGGAGEHLGVARVTAAARRSAIAARPSKKAKWRRKRSNSHHPSPHPLEEGQKAQEERKDCSLYSFLTRHLDATTKEIKVCICSFTAAAAAAAAARQICYSMSNDSQRDVILMV